MPHRLFVFMVGDPINGKCHCKNNECTDNYICNRGGHILWGWGWWVMGHWVLLETVSIISRSSLILDLLFIWVRVAMAKHWLAWQKMYKIGRNIWDTWQNMPDLWLNKSCRHGNAWSDIHAIDPTLLVDIFPTIVYVVCI